MKKENFLKRYSTIIPYVIVVVAIVGAFLYAFYRDYEERPWPLRSDQITSFSERMGTDYGVTEFEITYKTTQIYVRLKGPFLTEDDRQKILFQMGQLISSDSFQSFFEEKASLRYRDIRPFSADKKDNLYLDRWIPERIDVHMIDTKTDGEFEYFSDMPFTQWN